MSTLVQNPTPVAQRPSDILARAVVAAFKAHGIKAEAHGGGIVHVTIPSGPEQQFKPVKEQQ